MASSLKRGSGVDAVTAAHVAMAQMAVTSAQVRMARAALNWTVRDLAEAARLHRNTITNIETGSTWVAQSLW
jgi:DNA-binding XRE family transcriptional regulator